MQKVTEAGVEAKILEWLEELGWDTYGDPKNNIRGSKKLDKKYDRDPSQVVYWDLLKEKIVELNDIDEEEADKAIRQLKRDLGNEDLIDGNKEFYKKLKRGKKHKIQTDKGSEWTHLDLIHFPDTDDREEFVEELLDKNSFIALNQFSVRRPDEVRPDVNLFVNGIPLVTMELKNEADENRSKKDDSDLKKAIDELKDYEEDRKRLFIPGLLNVACDGNKFRCAAVGAKKEFYFPWRSEDYDEYDYEPRDAVKDLLDPYTLIDIFRYFVFYEDEAKITPRFMQYRAANKMIEQIKEGEHKTGLVWHTQGSGKSYTMLFTAYKAKKSDFVEDRQFLLIVDRTKLEDQMSEDLENIDFPLFSVAGKGDHLERLLKKDKNQLILTTIQKFKDVESDIKAEVEPKPVVLVDEAHRFTEGKLGNKLKAAVPDAFRFGLTGTPVVEGNSDEDRNTFQEFSSEERGYLHRYSLKEGQRDDVITEVTVTDATDISWSIPEEEMDEEFDEEFGDLPLERRQKILDNYVNNNELSKIEPRVNAVIDKIAWHYNSKLRGNGFKGLVVTPRRKIAALYSDKLRERLNEDEVEAVISVKDDDSSYVKKYKKSDGDERDLIEDFKKNENPKILVVCKKLLTGFDAPILKTLYLDRSLTNHNLLQAMARTNRPMEGKHSGEIVDFRGIFKNPQEALDYKDFEIVEDAVKDTEELAEEFNELLGGLVGILDDFELKNDPEILHKCKVKLQRDEDLGSKFESKYEEAEEIYESLMPHKLLGKDEVENKWSVVSQVYYKLQDSEEGRHPEEGVIRSDQVREKTRKILEKHLEVEKISEKKVEFEQPDRDVEFVEEDEEEPERGVATKGPVLKESLEEKKPENPAYTGLSEKVKEVVQDWKEGKTSEKALRELENVRDQMDELESEKNNLGMDDTEFSLYKLITEDYSEYISDDTEAEEIANDVGTKLRSNKLSIDYSEAEKSVRRILIETLAAEKEKENLAVDNNKKFLKEASNYILENEYNA